MAKAKRKFKSALGKAKAKAKLKGRIKLAKAKKSSAKVGSSVVSTLRSVLPASIKNQLPSSSFGSSARKGRIFAGASSARPISRAKKAKSTTVRRKKASSKIAPLARKARSSKSSFSRVRRAA